MVALALVFLFCSLGVLCLSVCVWIWWFGLFWRRGWLNDERECMLSGGDGKGVLENDRVLLKQWDSLLGYDGSLQEDDEDEYEV